jgi:hypothetical protein
VDGDFDDYRAELLEALGETLAKPAEVPSWERAMQ